MLNQWTRKIAASAFFLAKPLPFQNFTKHQPDPKLGLKANPTGEAGHWLVAGCLRSSNSNENLDLRCSQDTRRRTADAAGLAVGLGFLGGTEMRMGPQCTKMQHFLLQLLMFDGCSFSDWCFHLLPNGCLCLCDFGNDCFLKPWSRLSSMIIVKGCPAIHLSTKGPDIRTLTYGRFIQRTEKFSYVKTSNHDITWLVVTITFLLLRVYPVWHVSSFVIQVYD